MPTEPPHVAGLESTALAATGEPAMNKGEAAYAAYLALLLRAGEILRYDYQPEKLRLGPAVFYTPDFRLVLPNRSIVFDDVKGRKGAGFWAEEDAIVKIKTASELHPFIFRVVWPLKGKGAGWGIVEFGRRVVAGTRP